MGCEEVKRVTLGLFAALLSLSASSAAIAQTKNVDEVIPMSDPDDPYGSLGWRWCVWQNKSTQFGNRKVQTISANEKSLAS